MNAELQKILIEQIDKKLNDLQTLAQSATPGKGWINAVRSALGMSMRQLGKRLNMTAQSVKEIEEREITGSITLKNLRQAADALGMKLVYGLVPKDASIEGIIEKRSLDLAKEIVLRTSQNMKLEDQEITKEQIDKAILERAMQIRNEAPRHLWD